MKNTTPKKDKVEKSRRVQIDPDHFTVFKLKANWEKKMSKYCSQEEIETFKKRQELLNTIQSICVIEQKMMNHIEKDGLMPAGWIE